VPVDDIEIQARENDLVLATHGRSIWIFDDLTPIEKMDAAVAGAPLTFFPPRTATTWSIGNRRWSAGQKMFTAKNPAYGALLSYYLKDAAPAEAPKKGKDDKDKRDAAEEKPKPEAKGESAEKKEGKVKITVLNKDGKLVREFDGPGAAGVNRTNWDLRSNPPAEPTPEQQEAAAAGFGFGPRGPLVDPGEYTIKIKAGDQEATQKVTVEEDNRITFSAADRAARRELIDQLYALAKMTDKDRRTIEGIQTALKAAREQWKKDAGKPNTTKIPDDIVKAADELQKKVDAVADKFVRERPGLGDAGPAFEWKPDPLPNQTQNLLNDLNGFSAAPSTHQKEKLAELTPLVNDASAAVKRISEEDLPALNKKMNDAGIPHIVPAPPQSRGGRGGEEDGER
jgi:predicted transcriptional regulator